LMRKTEPPPEPSIEEILASIRKIISDDGEPTAEPAFDPYDSENVRKQAERAQAGEPAAEARRPEKTTVAKPVMEDRQSGNAVSSVPPTNERDSEEIFELTDDCLLEELENARAAASERKAAGAGREVAVAAINKTAASLASKAQEIGDAEIPSLESAKPDIPPLPTEEELAEINSVLSNVVAEMHQVSDVKGFEPPADLMPNMPEPRSASAVSSASQAMQTPASARPTPAPSSQKPVWSARNHRGAGKPKLTSDAEAENAKNAVSKAPQETAADTSATANTASPLMEAIATSLVTALADSNERQEKSVNNADAKAAAASAPEASSTQEPLPEAALAPDMDDTKFKSAAAEHTPPAGATPKKEASEASIANADNEPPVLPGEDVGDIPPPSEPAVSTQPDTARKGDTQPVAPVASTAAADTVAPAPAAPKATSAHMSASEASALPAGLEGNVKEMLKPMLASWLDENLPRLVEKAISDELAKRDLPKTK
jgi:cell pole-organizing protein PopZ